jgi:hypothetical protein
MEKETITKCMELCLLECRQYLKQNNLNIEFKECTRLCEACLSECEQLYQNHLKGLPLDAVYYNKFASLCGTFAAECENTECVYCKRCAEACRKFQLTNIFQPYQTEQTLSFAYGR